ncbi:MAG: inosine/xanthosine triphosphatase [Candidatus Paceibacterota bacterium]
MKIIVASENPVKIDAAKRGFERVFPDERLEVTGVKTESGVADQPLSDEECLRGAVNRVAGAHSSQPNASYWIGIESGVEELSSFCGEFTWVHIEDSTGRVGFARSATFPLPHDAFTIEGGRGSFAGCRRALQRDWYRKEARHHRRAYEGCYNAY